MAATGQPFRPLTEGRRVAGRSRGPRRKHRPETPATAYDATLVAAVLAQPDVVEAIWSLEEMRWTGRPGYSIRALVGAVLVKAVYALPTWARTARLIAGHEALRKAIGGAPSQWACYRFDEKLCRQPAVQAVLKEAAHTTGRQNREAPPEPADG
jgi:hypothetical protein